MYEKDAHVNIKYVNFNYVIFFNRLREMHDRFLNRESREEDLDLIQVLKKNLSDRDELLKKLQVNFCLQKV